MPAAEWFGIVAITIMVGAYAMENRHPHWIGVFAAGCLMAALYAYFIGSYPFFIAEGLWAVIASRRWHRMRKKALR